MRGKGKEAGHPKWGNVRKTRKVKMRSFISSILPTTGFPQHFLRKEFSVAFSFSGNAFLPNKLSTWLLHCKYVSTYVVKYRYTLMDASNEWNILASQKSFRLLGEMESQRWWVAAGDLEKNKTPSKSLGSGLWIFLKIMPLKCKESVRELVCSLSMTTTKN